MSGKRKYQLKQRAAEMAETRRRITEAAVDLHGTVGPARTTLSAVAQRAGVQRHTVYRHFPTEAELYRACSTHWLIANPLPDPAAWRAIERPQERLAHALDQLYAYYERSEPMLANVLRDLDLVDALQPTITPLQDFLAEGAATLTAGWNSRGRRRHLLRAALRHVLDFRTWRSLTADGQLARADAVELAAALVQAAA
ncbi:MAG TPA: helix-turn-helix domain-containing protein [Gaiellaceae bacterium]|jgi:AcrR family transcriptional regulator|nr:helix-turn-helix domain-containing protein [Gaiellaceae bacterium]